MTDDLDPRSIADDFEHALLLDYARATAAAPREDVFAGLMDQEEALIEAGFPPMSPFWVGALERFYGAAREGSVYRAVARVGRRGGKSSTMVRVAAAEGLYRDWPLTPGDPGVFAFFSTTSGEAESRLDMLSVVLESLGLRDGADYRVSADRKSKYIRLVDRNIWWRALPANFRTAVGFTLIGAVYDELARWRDERNGRNPAKHILQTVNKAMSTMVNHGAHEFYISSPWSELDAHYEAFERGDNSKQVVFYAPTWEANPTLDIPTCERLAEDDAEEGELSDFDREYRAIPMKASEETFFDGNALSDATTIYPIPAEAPIGSRITVGADFGFRSDHSALAVTARSGDTYKLVDFSMLRPSPGAPLKPSAVVESFAHTAKHYGAKAVMADGHYREAIVEHLANFKLGLHDAPADPAQAFVRFKTLLNQGRVVLPQHAGLLRDLKETRCKPTASGRITVLLPRRAGGGHADLVSALVLACWQKGGKKVKDEPEELTDAQCQEQEAFDRAYQRFIVGDDGGVPIVSTSQDSIYDEDLFPV
uniref:Putative terminase n=1 Tax=viral metagenome TaxID=1070528 RepID=A0A6H1ZUC3_9ZZZZ